MLLKRYIWLGLGLMVMIIGCNKKVPSQEKESKLPLTKENRLKEYPFNIGFGASLDQLFAKEGEIAAAQSNDFLSIYEYARTWQGYMGTLSYLYLKDDDAVVALSFDIPLITGITLEEVLATANGIYVKGTPELYELFFELEAGEAQRLSESEEHEFLFFKDHYAINITQEDQAGVINILYSYVNFDHDHQHAHGYEHNH